ncbi:hypothetical protein ACIA5C_16785 [Actinoplanes sp. NPDC051343]|uniref:hypothetical protein n=1 Tax=Actinoplanes sp. NPDC051343 TaxID=3363906 RepID=UPI0037BA111A
MSDLTWDDPAGGIVAIALPASGTVATMRWWVAVMVVLAGVVALPPPAGAAERRRVCQVRDDRLTELSGLVATGSGYVVVNDGSDLAGHRKIFYLNARCAVVRTVSYPSRPRDTEDLGIARDGTLWVADIGDNDAERGTVALWRLAPGAKAPVLYRLSYPDGAHDAEALLLAPSGTPVIVTKSVGAGGVYVPAGPLTAGRITPLRRVGDVALPVTTTSNPFSFGGRLLITGGAVSPDGRFAVLRTYADAFEFAVSGGDVVAAVTTGRARPVAMPDEPQGESVAYSADGTALLTVSEGSDPVILRYPLPGRAAVTSPAATRASRGPSSSARPSTSESARVAAAGHKGVLSFGRVVTGAILVAGALVLILTGASRRRR